MEFTKHLNITQSYPLPSPLELAKQFPVTPKQQRFINQAREEIRKILDGGDPRLLMIAGPCSIHHIGSALDYGQRLKKLACQIYATSLPVMRVYFEKPRTVRGWKGFLYDPHLNDTNDIVAGLHQTRKLLLELAEVGIPVATEFLDPASAFYFGDLIAWGCIGARTASSQTHRQLASALPMPIGFKNNTDGNLEVAINGVLSASQPHSFICHDMEGRLSKIQTTGNAHGHIVLRGSESGPNYDPQSISEALRLLAKQGLPSRLLVDCSHDNSFRQYQEQMTVFQSVISQISEGNTSVKGILLESHLQAGNQPFVSDSKQIKTNLSLTDGCLDWPSTERLLVWGHTKLLSMASNIQPISLQQQLFKTCH